MDTLRDVGWWPVRGIAVGAAGVGAYYLADSAMAAGAVWVLAPLLLHEPQSMWAVGILSAWASARLLPTIGADHWVAFAVGSQVLPRAAMAVLAWIGRPAVDLDSSRVTSRGAGLAIALGMLAAYFTGWHAWLQFVASILVVRAVFGVAYGRAGGVTNASLGWTRDVLAPLILAIGRLPESIL